VERTVGADDIKEGGHLDRFKKLRVTSDLVRDKDDLEKLKTRLDELEKTLEPGAERSITSVWTQWRIFEDCRRVFSDNLVMYRRPDAYDGKLFIERVSVGNDLTGFAECYWTSRARFPGLGPNQVEIQNPKKDDIRDLARATIDPSLDASVRFHFPMLEWKTQLSTAALRKTLVGFFAYALRTERLSLLDMHICFFNFPRFMGGLFDVFVAVLLSIDFNEFPRHPSSKTKEKTPTEANKFHYDKLRMPLGFINLYAQCVSIIVKDYGELRGLYLVFRPACGGGANDLWLIERFLDHSDDPDNEANTTTIYNPWRSKLIPISREMTTKVFRDPPVAKEGARGFSELQEARRLREETEPGDAYIFEDAIKNKGMTAHDALKLIGSVSLERSREMENTAQWEVSQKTIKDELSGELPRRMPFVFTRQKAFKEHGIPHRAWQDIVYGRLYDQSIVLSPLTVAVKKKKRSGEEDQWVLAISKKYLLKLSYINALEIARDLDNCFYGKSRRVLEVHPMDCISTAGFLNENQDGKITVVLQNPAPAKIDEWDEEILIKRRIACLRILCASPTIAEIARRVEYRYNAPSEHLTTDIQQGLYNQVHYHLDWDAIDDDRWREMHHLCEQVRTLSRPTARSVISFVVKWPFHMQWYRNRNLDIDTQKKVEAKLELIRTWYTDQGKEAVLSGTQSDICLLPLVREHQLKDDTEQKGKNPSAKIHWKKGDRQLLGWLSFMRHFVRGPVDASSAKETDETDYLWTGGARRPNQEIVCRIFGTLLHVMVVTDKSMIYGTSHPKSQTSKSSSIESKDEKSTREEKKTHIGAYEREEEANPDAQRKFIDELLSENSRPIQDNPQYDNVVNNEGILQMRRELLGYYASNFFTKGSYNRPLFFIRNAVERKDSPSNPSRQFRLAAEGFPINDDNDVENAYYEGKRQFAEDGMYRERMMAEREARLYHEAVEAVDAAGTDEEKRSLAEVRPLLRPRTEGEYKIFFPSKKWSLGAKQENKMEEKERKYQVKTTEEEETKQQPWLPPASSSRSSSNRSQSSASSSSPLLSSGVFPSAYSIHAGSNDSRVGEGYI